MTADSTPVEGSFRDPSGFLFVRNGALCRQINEEYARHYDLMVESGLYTGLTEAGLLVPHEEVDRSLQAAPGAYAVIRPERLPFISYPYEWSFSQLKDAALATLEIQKRAIAAGMSLKDASAYNIQFREGTPLLIDTLSFEELRPGEPWCAYRQFCQHFLAPLALMAHVDVRLGQLLRTHIDGVPLDLTSRLLPWKTRLSFGLASHIHLHAAAQQRYAGRATNGSKPAVSEMALRGMIDSLEVTVKTLRWEPAGTEWADYYASTNYVADAMEAKKWLVDEFLGAITPAPSTVWDLGANTGVFSRIAASRGAATIAWDIDPAAVDRNYLEARRSGEGRVLPLLQDLTNPSPGLGWAHRERDSLRSRGPADAVMALALVHHLAIANNVPLVEVARFFSELGRWLIIEFVPKCDSQVQRLLASREDIFPGYTSAGFEQAFGEHFTIRRRAVIPGSERTLYLMEKV